MKTIYFEIPKDKQKDLQLKKAKIDDVLKICFNSPISEIKLFQMIKSISDLDTAIAFFSSNTNLRLLAEKIVFSKLVALVEEHRQDIGFTISFKVLRELYRMEQEGIPINKERLLQASDTYLKQSKHSVQELIKKADAVGITLSERDIRGRVFSFPAEYTELNVQLAKVRKDIRHADMLKREKINQYIVDDIQGNVRLMTKWDLYGSSSGRIQTSSFNIQGLQKQIREECIVARSGYSLILADYISEELVLIAILTEDMELLKEIMAGVDLHKKVASIIFSKDIANITKEERSLAKAVDFAYLYGAGDATLENIISDKWSDGRISVHKVKNAINQIFTNVEECIFQLKKQGYLRLINGQRIHVEDIPKNYTLFNRMVQGSGAVILKEVIAVLSEQLPPTAKICFLLHDEIIVEVSDREAEQCKEVVTKTMVHILKKFDINIAMPVSVSIKKGGENV